MTGHRVLPTGFEIEFLLQFPQNGLLTAKNNEDDNSLPSDDEEADSITEGSSEKQTDSDLSS